MTGQAHAIAMVLEAVGQKVGAEPGAVALLASLACERHDNVREMVVNEMARDWGIHVPVSRKVWGEVASYLVERMES